MSFIIVTIANFITPYLLLGGTFVKGWKGGVDGLWEGKIFFLNSYLNVYVHCCTCTGRDMPADKKSFPTQASLQFIYHYFCFVVQWK